MAPGKGILAADESTGTIGKRFTPIGVENVEENRRAYRHLLFTAEGLGEYISGAITYEETLFQKDDEGTAFPELLRRIGVIPGIKVDLVRRAGPRGSRDRWARAALSWAAPPCAPGVGRGARSPGSTSSESPTSRSPRAPAHRG